MPLAKIVRRSDPKHQSLRERLVQEWTAPNSSDSEPVIIEEGSVSMGQNFTAHLYVIWSEWADLDQTERSEIIMDACEQVRGRDFALNVTVAMGLTTTEAQRMGIEYAPLENAA